MPHVITAHFPHCSFIIMYIYLRHLSCYIAFLLFLFPYSIYKMHFKQEFWILLLPFSDRSFMLLSQDKTCKAGKVNDIWTLGVSKRTGNLRFLIFTNRDLVCTFLPSNACITFFSCSSRMSSKIPPFLWALSYINGSSLKLIWSWSNSLTKSVCSTFI